MALKILYIHHCGTQGGSSRSLREMIQAFPENTVQPHIISPKGTAANYFKELNVPIIETIGISQFDMTQAGYYRKLRWLILLREICYIPFTVIAILKAKKRWKNIDIIHVNDIQSLFPLFLAKKIFGLPVVLHVRCPVITKKGRRVNFLKRFIPKYASRVLAIDKTVKYTLPKGINIDVVHNGLILPKSRETQKETKKKRLTFGMVSNLLAYKGVLDFVEAAKICQEKGLEIDFTIIGGRSNQKRGIIERTLKVFGFRQYADEEVDNLLKEYNLLENFKIEGFVQNLALAYNKIDVLCFPSHINAVGRPVFEAGFFSVPSIVAIDNPLNDAIINMETGICISQKSPPDLAEAITYFYTNPSEITRMGENAHKLANEYYDIHKNALDALEIYRSVLEQHDMKKEIEK
ncbi:MAG: glycosyltransferase family 4 protein [Bacteroidota bacterium]